MGITTPTGTALTIAEQALEAAAGMVVNYLGFDPSLSTITEYLDGYGSRDISLQRWPVTSITSVHEQREGYSGQSPDPFPADTLLVQGEDYTWNRSEGGRNGVLTRLRRFWPYAWTRDVLRIAFSTGPLRGCIKVVYVVDNSGVLAAAQQAAYMEATVQYRGMTSGMGTFLSNSVDGMSATVTALQRTNSNDPRDVFASPYAAGPLRLYRKGGLV
jgi:hypothetical protein